MVKPQKLKKQVCLAEYKVVWCSDFPLQQIVMWGAVKCELGCCDFPDHRSIFQAVTTTELITAVASM